MPFELLELSLYTVWGEARRPKNVWWCNGRLFGEEVFQLQLYAYCSKADEDSVRDRFVSRLCRIWATVDEQILAWVKADDEDILFSGRSSSNSSRWRLLKRVHCRLCRRGDCTILVPFDVQTVFLTVDEVSSQLPWRRITRSRNDDWEI